SHAQRSSKGFQSLPWLSESLHDPSVEQQSRLTGNSTIHRSCQVGSGQVEVSRIGRDLTAQVEGLRIPGILLKAHVDEPERDGQVFVLFSFLCPPYPVERLPHPVMLRDRDCA